MTFFEISEWKLVFTLVFVMIVHLVRNIVLPPLNFPKNIPTIPFYVLFLGALTKWDQEKIYNMHFREKLEKYGAVKVYFGLRWNILITRPQFLAQVLRNDDVFVKSGNQIKLPWGIFSEYLGDNIISASPHNWNLYRQVMTKAILFSDIGPLAENTAKLIQKIKKCDIGRPLAISDILQRFTLANIGDCVLGVHLRTLDEGENPEIYKNLNFVKLQVFKPLFLMFPLLDRLPIPMRVEARKAVRAFKESYCRTIINERSPENCTRLGTALANAYEDGIITKKQFEDNAIIVLVAGHENPQLLLTSLLYVSAKFKESQTKVRNEIQGHENWIELPYFTSFVYETLRMYPPIGQLFNRKVSETVSLGKDIIIPEGTYVGYNCFGTQRDHGYWGEQADEFRPERWGCTKEEISTNYALSKSRCTLPAFHGRARACLGEKFALYQVKLAIGEILRNFEISLDLHWEDRITLAGVIHPVGLSLVFKALDGTDE